MFGGSTNGANPRGLEPTARNTDPGTSWAASKRVAAGNIRWRILAALATRGPYGAICDELPPLTSALLQSITPRMRELEKRGLAMRAGTLRTGAAGVDREVWIISDAGRALLAAGGDEPRKEVR